LRWSGGVIEEGHENRNCACEQLRVTCANDAKLGLV
jgi:hypothetical protein